VSAERYLKIVSSEIDAAGTDALWNRCPARPATGNKTHVYRVHVRQAIRPRHVFYAEPFEKKKKLVGVRVNVRNICTVRYELEQRTRRAGFIGRVGPDDNIRLKFISFYFSGNSYSKRNKACSVLFSRAWTSCRSL